MNSQISKPTITISLKKPSIRIYKEALHKIENPEYIFFSIDFLDKSLLIIPSIKFDTKAHNVGKYLNNTSKSVVLYSTPLINSLKALCKDWKNNKTYKMFGQVIVLDKKCIRFNLSEANAIN